LSPWPAGGEVKAGAGEHGEQDHAVGDGDRKRAQCLVHCAGLLKASAPCSLPARTGIRTRQRLVHPVRQPGSVGQFPQHSHPACDTTPTPSALTFTRRDHLLRFTAERLLVRTSTDLDTP